MIRINLLPIRASKKREAGKQWIVLFALAVGITLAVNYYWFYVTDAAVQLVKARVNKYNSDLQTLNKIIGEVKNIKDDKAAIEKKLGVLKKLKDNRTGPVKVMDEVSTIIPPKVWLTSWDENGGSVTFQASAATLDDVADFLSKIKASKFFTNPILKNTRAGDSKVDFVITAQVKYSA